MKLSAIKFQMTTPQCQLDFHYTAYISDWEVITWVHFHHNFPNSKQYLTCQRQDKKSIQSQPASSYACERHSSHKHASLILCDKIFFIFVSEKQLSEIKVLSVMTLKVRRHRPI